LDQACARWAKTRRVPGWWPAYVGQWQIVSGRVISKGFLAVRVVLDDEDFARELPLGGAEMVAIYTDVGNAFHVISKITLRIKG
jgi:hypothetical protein